MTRRSSLARRFGRSAGTALSLAAAIAVPVAPSLAFCGFYVAQADSKLFNTSSKVVLAWDAGRASVTMASDYEGDPKEFALVVPVPTVVKEQDIRVVDPKLVDKLDAYSAPRLTEYYDEDPCRPPVVAMSAMMLPMPAPMVAKASAPASGGNGVTIEARYEVGVYDILILSAKDSSGLVRWLETNAYQIPAGAGDVLGSYIRQGMHFFVAKVNMARQSQGGERYLKPLQVSYQTKKFMLPIRLGTVNAKGPQDLIVFALTRKGRIEASNYQTAKMDSDVAVPLFVKKKFGQVYKSAFATRVDEDGMSKVYTEYAWDMRGTSPCDPCAAPVPDAVDLFTLGARWHYPQFASADAKTLAAAKFVPAGNDAYLTRLHVRYDARHFPEDLAFLETADRSSFQAIYKLQHPPQSVGSCPAGDAYLATLPDRFSLEARNLARLTGWSETSIRQQMDQDGQTIAAISRY